MTRIFSQNHFQENTRLVAALDLADLGCWELNLPDQKFWISKRFQSHFEFAGSSVVSYEDMIGLVHSKDRENVRKSIDEALIAGSDGKFDVQLRTHAGHLGRAYWVNWKGQASFSDDGSPAHFSGILQNITGQVLSRKLLVKNEALIQTNQLLFKSNENLRQFAYIASHDLQEPLRKIQSLGDLLRRRINTNLDGIEYLDRMQHAARRMSVLIEDVLTFSHVSSSRHEFSVVDLNEVFKGILSDLETSIDQSGAVISVTDLPSLKGDARQLSQLFQNLLSNAIKFRREDAPPKIKIVWTILKASNLPAHFPDDIPLRSYDCIAITDNGIGFDTKNEERIFKVFQRLHGKSEYEGTGIGLAICEKVVTNHKGIIRVESQIGIGSTFSIYLPIQ